MAFLNKDIEELMGKQGQVLKKDGKKEIKLSPAKQKEFFSKALFEFFEINKVYSKDNYVSFFRQAYTQKDHYKHIKEQIKNVFDIKVCEEAKKVAVDLVNKAFKRFKNRPICPSCGSEDIGSNIASNDICGPGHESWEINVSCNICGTMFHRISKDEDSD